MNARTALVMAGGTGGHVMPALAVAEALRAEGWRVVWLGTHAGMEAKLAVAKGFDMAWVKVAGVRGKGLVTKLLLPFNLLIAFWQAARAIFRERPDVALGLGGYVAFPGGMMAVLLNKPLVIHEQNAVAGLTNKILARIADRVLLGLPLASPLSPREEWVGNPVRPEIAALPAPQQRLAGREGPLRLLVIGGSLGAQALNEMIPQALALLPAEHRPVVKHQSGAKHLDALKANYAQAGVAAEPLAFIDDMAAAYAWADVVICRAGALTVAEIAAAGLPALFVPFPFAVDDHQTGNAAFLADQGAAWLLQQKDLTPAKLAEWLAGLTRAELLVRAVKARALAKPDATASVVAVVKELGEMKHKVNRIHFVGIGGAGMSGIAEVLINLGYRVSGSDGASNAVTKRLADMGAAVFQGHAGENVLGTDVLVISSAIKEDNPEVQAARAAHIPVVARAMMLAELMRFKQGIAIAGTHGKTTTTSLIASVLNEAGLDPTFVIGGKLLAAGANARLGTGEWLVAEADESDASFLHLSPVVSIVTNIDADHMETYGHDFERLKSAFVEFLHRLPFWGMAILCADDPVVRTLLPRIDKPVTTYGTTDDCAIQAVNIRAEDGQMRFTALRNGIRSPVDITLNMPGMHNVLNALAAVAVAWELQVPDAAVQRALANFSGVGRRFQRYGEITLASLPAAGPSQGGQSAPSGGSEPGLRAWGRTFTLIDDYGHHPVEMQATLNAARGAFPGRRLVLAFQPHRYTRTRDLFEDFVRVLSQADAVLLTEVYAASEQPIVAADGRALSRALRVAGKVEPVFVENVADLPVALADFVRDGDVVLTMGAGSIGQVPARIAEMGV